MRPDNVPSGTKSPHKKKPKKPDANGKVDPGNKKGGGASQPDTSKKQKIPSQIAALNPPFDPRMRRIGSPLNLTSKIQRGWIQTSEEETDQYRINFLFNPSQLDLVHSIDPNNTRLDAQTPPDDVTDPYYTSTGSSTGVKLLYDRTYELFSSPKDPANQSFANKYGVWADVAAWYVFTGMLPDMPTDWTDSLITQPAQMRRAFLFVGPNLVYYGWVTGVNVTYSHWTQNMIPQRCSVDVGFQILPFNGNVALPGSPGSGTNSGTSDEWSLGWGKSFLDGAGDAITGANNTAANPGGAIADDIGQFISDNGGSAFQ